MKLKFIKHAADPAGDEVRIETLRGREWLVAPVVLVREGVLNGGFLGYDEILKSEPGWNGRPVTVPPADGTEAANGMPDEGRSGHPLVENSSGEPEFVSANQLPFYEDMHLGFVDNVEASEDLPDDDGEMSNRGLVGEAWIDVHRAEELGSYALETVRRVAEGEALDVSTGYFHRPVETQGRHEGDRYEFEQNELMPDHLAMLPTETGACSWADGCGAPHPAAAANADGDAGLWDRIKGMADLDDSAGCSPGPCSCGDHTVGNAGDGTASNPSDRQILTNTMKYDIQQLAERTAFDAETLRGWDDSQLATLSETVEANDDGGDGDDDGDDDPTDGQNGDGGSADGGDAAANAELVERLETLEAQNEELREQFEAERNERRQDLAERVAAHTDHDAEDLAENAEDYPDAALEAMADAVDDGGNSQGYAAPQGNRVNFLGQAGAQDDPADGSPDVDDYTANVGALASLSESEQAGD